MGRIPWTKTAEKPSRHRRPITRAIPLSLPTAVRMLRARTVRFQRQHIILWGGLVSSIAGSLLPVRRPSPLALLVALGLLTIPRIPRTARRTQIGYDAWRHRSGSLPTGHHRPQPHLRGLRQRRWPGSRATTAGRGRKAGRAMGARHLRWTGSSGHWPLNGDSAGGFFSKDCGDKFQQHGQH